MWMQQSMEGGRNHQQGGGYGGQPSSFGRPKDDDWKTRLVESGQWLGEKVMSLASGSTSSHDSGIGNRSYNDGRANWMAEIRNNTGSYSNSHSGGYNAGGYNAGGYQNDFATERPGSYSDSRPYSSNSNVTPYSDSNYRSQMQSFTYENKPTKKSTKKSNQKKHKKKVVSSSDDSDSSVASSSESPSESESEVSDAKSKKKKDLKKKTSKRMEVSSDGGSTDTAPETKPVKKIKAKRVGLKSKTSNYSYSLDTSKVTAAAAEEPTKSKKVGKKSKDAKKNAPAPVVDLLGVESLTISNSPAQTPFAAPAQPLSTIDQLAGLSFDMPVQNNQSFDVLGMGNQPTQQHQPLLGQAQSQFPQNNSLLNSNFQQTSQQPTTLQEPQKPVAKPQPTGFIVPGSDLVDLRTQSEVSKAKVASDPRSLNELQQLNSHPPPQPVMPPPPQPTMGMMQPMMAMQPYMLQQGGYPAYHPHDPNAQRNMMLMMQQQQQQQQQMTPGFF